jgi:type IV fimbrial biogenesis protein FimT
MNTPCSKRLRRGFTLPELLIVVAVLGVLVGLAAPAMRNMVVAGQMRSASSDLVGDLILARSEAVKRRAQVLVQPSAGGWTGGWTIQTAGDAQQLASRNQLGAVKVTLAPDTITFDLDGRVLAAEPVRIGLSDGSHLRCISLDPSGRPKAIAVECEP